MKYLHAMVRVRDLMRRCASSAMGWVCGNRRIDVPEHRYTPVYLGAPENPEAEVELTFNYDDEDGGSACNRASGVQVDDITPAARTWRRA